MTEIFSHPIPAVLVMLGVLVFVHELGHFLVGRWSGIAVEIFSIGFGPKIVGFRHKGTDYRISWIPLGGFVKFAGAHPAEDVPDGLRGIAFRDAPLGKRALTIFAGPFANFLLAIAAYAFIGFDGIPHPPPVIGEVLENSAAQTAGIRTGDRFVKIDGEPIETWRDLERHISGAPGKELTITVEREGRPEVLKLTPAAIEAEDLLGKKVTIGRAGIALGKLPPVVAVTDPSTPAGLAGLRTGERIVAVTAGDQTYETPGFPELVTALERAAAAGGPAVVQLQVKGAGKVESANTSTLMLDLAAARDRPEPLRGKDLLRALGIRDAQLAVGEATETTAGVLAKGDVMTHWKGEPLRDVFHLRELLMKNDQQTVAATVVRDFKPLAVELSLKPVQAQKPEGPVTVYMLPVLFLGQPEEPPPIIEKYDGLLGALGYGLRETGRQSTMLVDNVKSLFTGEIPLKALGGPMLIAKVAGDSAARGWQTFLGSMALISINLGILNLFPIPVLDGGQLVLMGAEAVRRRPLRESAVENFQKVGFAMILALVVLATYNDLSRFWRSMLESVVGIFQ